MVIAKCYRCGGSAEGKSFEEASEKINHAVGLSRGIPCGDNFNAVEEIKDTPVNTKQSPKQSPKESGQDTSYSKVEGKSTEKVLLDEAKTGSFKKSKKQY